MDNWVGNSVFDLQMYDNTNRETFGYGSIGIFRNDHSDGVKGIKLVTPLSGGQSC